MIVKLPSAPEMLVQLKARRCGVPRDLEAPFASNPRFTPCPNSDQITPHISRFQTIQTLNAISHMSNFVTSKSPAQTMISPSKLLIRGKSAKFAPRQNRSSDPSQDLIISYQAPKPINLVCSCFVLWGAW
jgi:hypothetical protein